MYRSKKVACIIPASGTGTRMQSAVKKQYLTIGGFEVLEWALVSLATSPLIDCFYVVVPEEDVDDVAAKLALWRLKHSFSAMFKVIAGGETRQASVYEALKCLEEAYEYVLVHDGVRPFPSLDWVEEHLKHLDVYEGVSIGYPAIDTLKIVNALNEVLSTLPRKDVWTVQTPQLFRREVLIKAHKRALLESVVGTDDLSLLESMGASVAVFMGDRHNIKVTTPFDLIVGEAIVALKALKE